MSEFPDDDGFVNSADGMSEFVENLKKEMAEKELRRKNGIPEEPYDELQEWVQRYYNSL